MIATDETFLMPRSIDEAVALMSDGGREKVLLAGGTWVMRTTSRGERGDPAFVSLAGIAGLRDIAEDADGMRIGPLVTHQDLAFAVRGRAGMAALEQAARLSATPAIRHSATIGGNICARGFAAPDLVPALIALDAVLEIQTQAGQQTQGVEEYIKARGTQPADHIVTAIKVPRQTGRSAHARALLRQAGEYPVATLSACLETDADGHVTSLRIAVGSVTAMPCRWGVLEQALTGQKVNATAAADTARGLVSVFTARDGVDAPGWYRLRRLPGLVEQAIADVLAQGGVSA